MRVDDWVNLSLDKSVSESVSGSMIQSVSDRMGE